MCEEEIIKELESLSPSETAIIGILDLYNKEKEKNTFGVISKDKIRKTIEEIKDLLKQIDYHDIKDKNEREFYKTQYMQYVVARNILQGLLEDNI